MARKTFTHVYGRFVGTGRTQDAAHEDACRQANEAREAARRARPDCLAVRSASRIGATEFVAVYAKSHTGREGYFVVPRAPYRECYARDEVYFIDETNEPATTEAVFYAA